VITEDGTPVTFTSTIRLGFVMNDGSSIAGQRYRRLAIEDNVLKGVPLRPTDREVQLPIDTIDYGNLSLPSMGKTVALIVPLTAAFVGFARPRTSALDQLGAAELASREPRPAPAALTSAPLVPCQ